MAMLEWNLGGKTPQPLVYKLEERMEVAQVILGLTMEAEEQRDGMAAQSTLQISSQDLSQLGLNNAGFIYWN